VTSGSADAVIFGAGPAGSATAIELNRAGASTVIVAGPERRTIRVGEAIPPVAKPLLQHLGVWDALAGDGHRVARGTESAWGEPHLRTTSFIRDPHGHGWILDRVRFDTRLQDVARLGGTTIVRDARPTACRRSGGQWIVEIADGLGRRRITTPWVIDASGRRSWLTRFTHTRRTAVDRLVAFVAHYRVGHAGDSEVDAMTLVESSADGWWYTVALPNNNRLVAYLTDANDPSARVARTAAGFVALASSTRFIQHRLPGGHDTLCDGPLIVAADSSRLAGVAGDGWLAAGDAAASFDPLSSQGILTAFDLGVAAARVLVAPTAEVRDAAARYCGRVDALYETYLTRRREIYSQEQRWPQNRFWRDRHSAGAGGLN
jgi:flavin-dependent dehydrogenase